MKENRERGGKKVEKPEQRSQGMRKREGKQEMRKEKKE